MELARAYTEEAIELAVPLMRNKRTPARVRAHCIEILLDPGWGRLAQALVHAVDGDGTQIEGCTGLTALLLAARTQNAREEEQLRLTSQNSLPSEDIAATDLEPSGRTAALTRAVASEPIVEAEPVALPKRRYAPYNIGSLAAAFGLIGGAASAAQHLIGAPLPPINLYPVYKKLPPPKQLLNLAMLEIESFINELVRTEAMHAYPFKRCKGCLCLA